MDKMEAKRDRRPGLPVMGKKKWNNHDMKESTSTVAEPTVQEVNLTDG